MVGNIIPRPFQWYMSLLYNSLGIRRYEFLCKTTQTKSSSRPSQSLHQLALKVSKETL
jgi:hypothetical protein